MEIPGQAFSPNISLIICKFVGFCLIKIAEQKIILKSVLKLFHLLSKKNPIHSFF